jgi:hypothetical protein
MATPVAEQKSEKGKPHATTQDQIAEMEGEGQAQTSGQEAPDEAPATDGTEGGPPPVPIREPSPAPVHTPPPPSQPPTPTSDPHEPTPGASSDQDIDTAGTEADEHSAINNPKGASGSPSSEVPGDTNSADIVGPTGEQMPKPSHQGVNKGSQPPVV